MAGSVEYERVELFYDYHGSLIVPAGLTSRVCQALRDFSITYRFEDLRERVLCEPDYTKLEPLREKQDEILAAIICNDGGIIDAPTGAGKSFIIRLICRLWSKSKIIIACYSADITAQTYTELKELIPWDQVGMVGGGYNETGRRITCAVDRSLGKCDLNGCDIFIYDEVHRAAAPQTKGIIAKVPNARMYGFSASWKGRSDGADLETEAMFGPVICHMTYEDIQKTGSIVPLYVYQLDTQRFAPVTAMTTSALERHGLWRNDERNELIADAVKYIRHHLGADVQILITVKTIEHAVYLGSHLPDFQLVYATMDPDKRERWEREKLIAPGTHPITADDRERFRKEFRAGTLRRVIATGVWGTGIDFPQLPVLIRADGQASPIPNTQLPGRACRGADGKEYAIIVDLDDKFNQTLEDRARRRFALYRKKKWQIHPLSLGSMSIPSA